MKQVQQLSLAPYTSFHCGGNAEEAVIFDTIEPIDTEKLHNLQRPLQFLGFGCNTLVSDKGLSGTTLIFRAGKITQDSNTLIADAGVWWDDLVQYAINRNLWGLEFTSFIPGGVGAAVVGNIAAYGQAVSDRLIWAEVLNTDTNELRRYSTDELKMEYRISHTLQENRQLLVIRAAFELSTEPTQDLEYASAAMIAEEKSYDLSTLAGRRQTIYEAREKAGSLWDYHDKNAIRTTGSFFRNPIVNTELAESIMDFDETGKSHALLRTMNRVHGGESSRVSAAHVLLAAGYNRGQSWPNGVRLHPQHVLKFENYNNATSQAIYDVAAEIISTVEQKLSVSLVPETYFMGEFDTPNH